MLNIMELMILIAQVALLGCWPFLSGGSVVVDFLFIVIPIAGRL